MKICIPVQRSVSDDYEINPEMRDTEALLMVDSVTGFQELVAVEGSACQAVPDDVDVVICTGGVGMGMFKGWMVRGVRVFYSEDKMTSDALRKFKEGALPEVVEAPACSCGGHGGCGGHGHDHGHEHSHDHGHGHSCGCGGHQH